MALRYWVISGGSSTGTWSTSNTANWATSSGGVGGASVPGAGDTATFDNLSSVASYTVTQSSNVTCANIIYGAPTSGTLTLAGTGNRTVTASISTPASGFSFGTWSGTLTLNGGGAITIKSNGISYKSITVSTNLTSVTQQDALTCAVLTLSNSASWHTGNFALNATDITTATGTFDYGTSAVTIGTEVNFGNTTITQSAGSSLSCGVFSITKASQSFGAVTINGVSTVAPLNSLPTSGTTTFASLEIAPTSSGVATTSALPSNITVTGLFTASGFDATVNRLLFQSSAVGAARTITAGSVSLTNVDFMDITGAGAATWSGTSVGNMGGNSNITFTTPVTRFWVKATSANWNDANGWATSTGGTPGASVPICNDTANIDGNSGTATVTINQPRPCANINCTGFGGTLVYGVNGLSINGSQTLSAGMTFNATDTSVFTGRGSNMLTSAGQSFANQVTLAAPGGTLTQQDAASYSNGFIVTNGTYADGGNNLSATVFTNSGTVTKSGTWTFTGTGTVLTVASAGGDVWTDTGGAVVINNSSAATKTVSLGSGTNSVKAITLVSAGTGGLTLLNIANASPSNVGILTVSNAPQSMTIMGQGAATLNIGAFNCSGTPGNLNSFTSSGVTLANSSPGVVANDYLLLTNVAVSALGSWYAGTHSTDNGGNTNWIFANPPIGRAANINQAVNRAASF